MFHIFKKIIPRIRIRIRMGSSCKIILVKFRLSEKHTKFEKSIVYGVDKSAGFTQ